MSDRKLMAQIVFSGDLEESDPDGCAEELRKAGFTVFRLPDNHPLLAHYLDDFIEVTVPGAADDRIIHALMAEIDGIAHRHGGLCAEYGPISADYVPFSDLFASAID